VRYFFLLLQLLILSVSATADEDKIFAEKALAAIFSVDDELYRSLVHSKMSQCVNRVWNRKPGNPPDDYDFTITEDTKQGINNAKFGGRMVGLKAPSFPVMPTHQIAFTWEKEAEYFSGHPCYSEKSGQLQMLLVRESEEWRITSLCVSEAEADSLTENRRLGLKGSKERESQVDGLYANLSTQKRTEFQDVLSGNKVKAIYAYSEELGVDITTANTQTPSSTNLFGVPL
jgi:hypothetical protein